MLIAIEGGDGSGKDTIAELVARVTRAELIRFPDDNAVTGPLIRSYLRKAWALHKHLKSEHGPGRGTPYVDDEPMVESALAFQALNVANRMERMPEINARVEDGEAVVLVRYWQSGWVYGSLDGLDPQWLRQVHMSMRHADVNILLDIDHEQAMERRVARDGDLPPERYEGKVAFVQRVLGMYRRLWNDPACREGFKGRWEVVDANRPIDEVLLDVLRVVFSAQQCA